MGSSLQGWVEHAPFLLLPVILALSYRSWVFRTALLLQTICKKRYMGPKWELLFSFSQKQNQTFFFFFFFLSSSYEFLIDSLDWVALFWQQQSLEGGRFVSISILSVLCEMDGFGAVLILDLLLWELWIVVSCGLQEKLKEESPLFTQVIQPCDGGAWWDTGAAVYGVLSAVGHLSLQQRSWDVSLLLLSEQDWGLCIQGPAAAKK